VPGVPANAFPAKVLNLSLGGEGDCTMAYQDAINSARSRGAVVVVAAGNDGSDAAFFSPASCPGVIPVAAVGRTGALAYYSNHGNPVMVAAPGGDMSFGEANGILSTFNTGVHGPGADSYAYLQGTSMAAPHVAGVVALMLSRNPALTPNQVLARLRSNTKPFPEDCLGCGSGIVDGYWAASAAIATAVAEKENNNTIGTAQIVSPANAAVSGAMLAVEGDVDFYRVTVAAGRTLRASMAPTSASRDFDLYMLNGAGKVLMSSDRGAGQTDRVYYANTGGASVNVYVKVLYYGGGAGGYTLSMRQ
jgi:serine protease